MVLGNSDFHFGIIPNTKSAIAHSSEGQLQSSALLGAAHSPDLFLAKICI